MKKLATILGIVSLLRNLQAKFIRGWFLKFYLTDEQKNTFTATSDPVRYGSIYLAIETIKKENIVGDFAEAGVYQGRTSKLIHQFAPDRNYYLFDTFEGFPDEDLEVEKDKRFKTTNLDIVKKNIGDLTNIFFKVGYFPETAQGLEDNQFAFVMLDLDLYKPTIAGLNFFYNRVPRGGYIFLHDYNSPESDWGISRAVKEFMADKPETPIEIPDMGGSLIIRKI